jgi:hypothetical protein
MFCYSNNGGSMRAVATGYIAQAGEVIFPDYATDEELSSAFAGYAAVNAAKTAIFSAQSALGGTVTVSSSGTPAINGNYPVDATTQAKLNAVTTYVMLNGAFPGDSSSMAWLDASGSVHTFPSIAVFKAFATAIADFVAKVSLYRDSGGTVGAIPSTAISIA